MCCTKISGLDYFSNSRNCNLHLLVHKVFLKFRCENEIKQTLSSRYIFTEKRLLKFTLSKDAIIRHRDTSD